MSIRIGFTGHRDFTDVKLVDRWINGIATRHPQATIITGAAIGADLLTAEATVRNDNLKSLVILPMLPTTFTARWNLTQVDCLHAILQNSDIYLMSEYRRLSYNRLLERDYAHAENQKYEPAFLTERNRLIVQNSNFMVAFWDGRQSGGTFNAVRYALQKDVPIFQGFPTVKRWKENGKIKELYSFPEITRDEPLSDFFKTEEPCIEGFERLQEKIGYTNFATYALSADMFASNGNVFERHDDTSVTFRETPLDPSNSLIATLKATLNVPSDFAKDLARQIEEVGIEHKDYFVSQFKKNPFFALQELKFLADGLSDLQENPEDVFSRVNVENVTLLQSFNDDPSEDDFDEMDGDQIICDPSTAWHKIDETFRTSIDAALPLPPEPQNPVFHHLLAKAQTRTPQIGKEIYALQKERKVKLSYEQWNLIWAEYKGKAQPRFGERVGKIPPPGPAHKPLVITAMPTPTPTQETTFVPDPNYRGVFELDRLDRNRPTKLVNPLSERALKAKAMSNGSQHKFIQTGVFCTHCIKDACPKGCFGHVPKLIPGMMKLTEKLVTFLPTTEEVYWGTDTPPTTLLLWTSCQKPVDSEFLPLQHCTCCGRRVLFSFEQGDGVVCEVCYEYFLDFFASAPQNGAFYCSDYIGHVPEPIPAMMRVVEASNGDVNEQDCRDFGKQRRRLTPDELRERERDDEERETFCGY